MRWTPQPTAVPCDCLPRHWRSAPGAALVLCALLAGCASRPLTGSSSERDGPDPSPPANLAEVPDAEPKLEPIRPGGANKPYFVWGQNYVPLTQDAPYQEKGLASWYGRKFNGKPTASGELYNMYAMTAAHPTLPIPSYARITNPANGREVVVRINDRGPFHSSRIVDLSYTAALKLDILRGVTAVRLERITFEDIRTGAWRHDGAAQPVLAQAAPASALAPPPVATAASAAVAVNAADLLAVATPPPADLSPPPQPVGDAASIRALTATSRGYWVQLGAFRQHDGAVTFQKQVEAQMDWLTPLLTVFIDSALFKLQAGPYPSRDDARGAAERVRSALQLLPVIVERR